MMRVSITTLSHGIIGHGLLLLLLLLATYIGGVDLDGVGIGAHSHGELLAITLEALGGLALGAVNLVPVGRDLSSSLGGGDRGGNNSHLLISKATEVGLTQGGHSQKEREGSSTELHCCI